MANSNNIDWDNTVEYWHRSCRLVKDTKLRDMLNKKLSANIKHCFSNGVKKQKDEIDFGSGTIIIVNDKGEVNSLWSSEWAFIQRV